MGRERGKGGGGVGNRQVGGVGVGSGQKGRAGEGGGVGAGKGEGRVAGVVVEDLCPSQPSHSITIEV